MLGLRGLMTPWEGESNDIPPPIAAQREATVLGISKRSPSLGKLTPSCPLPGAVSFYDSNLLIVVLQLGFTHH